MRGWRWIIGIAALALTVLILVGLSPRFDRLGAFLDPNALASWTGEHPLFAMAVISLGTLASEDLACIAAGLLSASGQLPYPFAVLAAFFGIFVGDTLIYLLGYLYGRPLLKHRWSRWLVSERKTRLAEELFRQRGTWIILVTRFIPGTRTATYFSAGMLHAPPLRFLIVFALAAALWTPLLVGLSYLAGRPLFEYYEVYSAFAIPVLLAFGLFLYLLLHYILPMLTWRGRRRLRGRWLRAWRWEYWPAWQVNWLVLLYVLWIGCVRFRRPTLFTAVNPCMPHGGVVGENKAAILEGLSAAGPVVPSWTRLDCREPEAAGQQLADWMQENALSFPIVLKPEEGQRGLGVAIVRENHAAAEWIRQASGGAIAQAFVGGSEYGVFYFRYPSAPAGQIFSITVKEQLHVTGNGQDSIETLIHAHPRAIALLDRFLDRFHDRLGEVPPEGSLISLGEIGTHALGALFRDGSHLETAALRTEIARIAGALPGFWFGRFDIKAPDDAAFREGRELRVLELNGVTSEATHIYDPRNGLIHAWRTLCEQWRVAFEIGKENAARGAEVSRPWPFLKDTFGAMARQKQMQDS